jgi:hypothetical protein
MGRIDRRTELAAGWDVYYLEMCGAVHNGAAGCSATPCCMAWHFCNWAHIASMAVGATPLLMA